MYSRENKNMKTSYRKISNEESGVALVAVMLALLLITAIAAGIIILTNTETNTSSNFKDEQRAFFAAKSGIEEARDRLRLGNTYTVTRPTGLVGASANSVMYILNPLNGETVAPWNSANKYVDDEICNENFSGGTSLTCTTASSGKKLPSGTYYTSITANNTFAPGTGSVLDWKWARLNLKQSNAFGTGYYVNGNSASTGQVYWNGNSECLSGSKCTLPVYVITALAVTPSGSRRMVQMEAAEDQISFTAPAALTLDGNNDTFAGGNSSNYIVTGVDQGGCGSSAGAPSVPAIGVPAGNTTDLSNVISGIPSNRTGNYTGSGSTTPDVEAVTLPSSMTDPTTLQSWVSELKNDVTQPVLNCPTGCSGLTNPGTQAAPQIIFVNGGLTMSGNTVGHGILVITGDAVFKGTVEWDGLVLVVGTGSFTMEGTNTFKGAVVVANSVNSTGGTLSVLGAANGNVNGGGTSTGGIFYSASCLNQATQLTTFHSVSFRELMN
jgi:Tfp pilus assembly protein PilX